MNMVVNNVDYGSVGIGGNEFADETLNLAADDELAEGTILGRVTASGKLAIYAAGNADGSEVPVAVMPHAFSGLSGDNYIRPIISGRVNSDRLVIDDGTAVDSAVLDDLRNVSIVPVAVSQLADLDNQA